MANCILSANMVDAMRNVWVLVAVLALAGCGAIRPSVVDPTQEVATPGRFPLSIERGKWPGMNSIPLAVFVDGKLAATVGGGQVVTLYREPGRYIVGVGMNGHHPEKATPNAEVAVDVSEGSRPILHTNVSAMGYGGWKIERVSP